MERPGDLAALDEYSLLYGAPPEPPPEEQDPRQFTAPWAREAASNPGPYEANVGMFPPVKLPKALPDVGPPLIGSGGQFSPGTILGNRAGELGTKAGEAAVNFIVPQDAADVGLTVAGLRGLRAIPGARSIGGGLIASTAADEAEAAKRIKTPPKPAGFVAPQDPYPPGHILHGMKILGLRPQGIEMTEKEFMSGIAPSSPQVQEALKTNAFANPRLRAKAEDIWGKYPQYAEEYPAIGPPALMEKKPDPKNPGKYLSEALREVPYRSMAAAEKKDATPRYFFEKRLLPEVEQFQKQRNIVQRDMDLHGYTPYFDPAKRADIPASDYGPFKDTRVEAAPKTAKTEAKFDELYGTPAARERLQAGFAKGQTLEGAEQWYFMKQLQDKYVEVLGPQAGKEAFKKEFSGMMAATTGGASPYDNFLMSHWANYLNKQGENVAKRAYQMPFPIGGRFASGNMEQAQKYIDEGMVGFDPAKNPKRYDFDNALAGDKNAGVMDEQMFGAIMPGQTIPQWYGPATKVLHQEAGKAGMGHNLPQGVRDFQDVGWAGLKALKEEKRLGVPFKYEGPMIGQINRSIETTHRLTGMPIEEIVVRGLIKKEIPMYGLGTLGAGGVLGELAKQDSYDSGR